MNNFNSVLWYNILTIYDFQTGLQLSCSYNPSNLSVKLIAKNLNFSIISLEMPVNTLSNDNWFFFLINLNHEDFKLDFYITREKSDKYSDYSYNYSVFNPGKGLSNVTAFIFGQYSSINGFLVKIKDCRLYYQKVIDFNRELIQICNNSVYSLCYSNCLECYGPFKNNCLKCKQNFSLKGRECIENCKSNYYLQSNNNKCFPCDFSCKTCVNGYECTECSEGYYKNEEDLLCTKCPFKNCLNCNSKYCIECQKDYFLINKTGKCTIDKPIDLYFNKTEKKYFHCGKECKTCFGPKNGNCLSCKANLYPFLYNSSCVANCPSGYFSEKMICKICHTTCEECFGPNIDNCKKCLFPKFLDSEKNLCSECSENSILQEKKCLRCHFTCKTCSLTVKNCSSCANSAHFINLDRSCSEKCLEGYFSSSTKIMPEIKYCRKCPILNCLLCDGKQGEFCFKCKKGYYYKENTCLEQINLNLTIIEIANPFCFLIKFPENFQALFFNRIEFINIKMVKKEISKTDLKYNRFYIRNQLEPIILIDLDYINGVLPQNSKFLFSIKQSSESEKFNYNDYPYKVKNIIFNLKTMKICSSNKCFDLSKRVCIKNYILNPYLELEENPHYVLLRFDKPFHYFGKSLKDIIKIKIEGLKEDEYPYQIINIDNKYETFRFIFDFKKNSVRKRKMELEFFLSNNPFLKFCGLYLSSNYLSIQLQNYHKLSETQQMITNYSARILIINEIIYYSGIIIDGILKRSSSLAIRGLWIIQSIQSMKIIDINYPPNLVECFKRRNSRFIFYKLKKLKVKEKDRKNFKNVYKIYSIDPYLVNNVGTNLLNTICYIAIGFFFLGIDLIFEYFSVKNKGKTLYSFLLRIFNPFIYFFCWSYNLILILSQIKINWFFVMIQIKETNQNSKFPEINFILTYSFIMICIIIFMHLFFIIYNINEFEKEKKRKSEVMKIKMLQSEVEKLYNFDLTSGKRKKAIILHSTPFKIKKKILMVIILHNFFLFFQRLIFHSISFIANFILTSINKIFFLSYNINNITKYKKKYGLLHLGFKINSFFSVYFILIDIIRHVILKTLFVWLDYNPLVQISVIFIFNLSFSFLTIFLNPFKKKWNFKIQVFTEIFITFSLGLALVLAIFDYYLIENFEARLYIGYSIISFIMVLQIVIILNNFKRILTPYYEKLKKCCCKKKNQ